MLLVVVVSVDVWVVVKEREIESEREKVPGALNACNASWETDPTMAAVAIVSWEKKDTAERT